MSKISAPSATIRLAWSSAAAGSRNRPPSEKESGVTLSTPITSGRPSASSRVSGWRGATGAGAGVSTVRPRLMRPLIAYFQRQFLGQLDPAADRFDGRRRLDAAALAVG